MFAQLRLLAPWLATAGFAAVLLASALALTAVAAAAATATPAPSASPKTLDAIVVTAERHPEKIHDTPRQTFTVSGRELERLGAVNVADALRFIPGTIVQEYGPLGALGTVALRGASTAETLVLLNGRPVTEADTGTFDFSSLPAALVERVEVVEGGSSTLYGSNAVGGVINIITKQPGAGREFDAHVQTGYQGAFERGLGLSAGDERSLAVRLDAQSSAATDAFSFPAFAQLQPGGTRSDLDATLKHTALTMAHLFGTVRGSLALDDDAAAAGAPGSVAFASDFARQERVYQRMALDVDAPLPGGDIALQAYSDSRRLRFFNPAFQFDSHANGTFRGASLRITQALGTLHVLTAGWDSKGDVALFDAGFAGQAPSTVRDASAAWYLQDELHRAGAPLRVTVGLRSEHIQGTQSTTTPAIGILERVGTHLDASANYARAFRAPSLDERYYPFYGNPRVQPEYAATFDVGLRGDSGAASASLAWFGSDTNNLIVNVPIDSFGDVAPYNVNHAVVRGLEGNLQTMLGARWNAGLAYTDFIRAADLAPGRSPKRLQYRPSASGGIRLWREDRSWSYGLQGAFVGKRFADEANTQLMPAYFLTSAYLGRAIGKHTSLTLRVTNLGNNHLAEDELGYPIPGDALSVRLATRY